MTLYINYEHCLSVEQLKGYFQEDLTPDSNIYYDLLDCGRHGEIAIWLCDMDELELASRIESIPENLNDSAFFAQLKAIITGSIVEDPESLKRPFEECLAVESEKHEFKDNEARFCITLKVLEHVNEEYKLSVFNNWGTCEKTINPDTFTEGQTTNIDFTICKMPGREMGKTKIMADGKELVSIKNLSAEDDVKTSATGDEEFSVLNIRFKMIRVEGGSFTMGEGIDANQVTLSAYHIGEAPVTQELWQAVMGSNPSYFKGDKLPVEEVSWYDCQNFVKKLNQKTGKKFRLPTEAEWEFAARGGNKSKHTKYSGSNNLGEVAWYDSNSWSKTHPVKTKKPNELGIYDMSGNVWEWCQDWYDAYKGTSQTNPKGPTSGSCRVYRGGSWYNDAWDCRLSFRNRFTPGSARNSLGFRLALSE